MDQLKRLRAEKGLSQAKLAALADVDPSTVNQIERGAREASPATLRKLAQALEVSMAELLEDAAPKVERRSSREPSLWNGLEEERRSPAFADAMIALAEQWTAQVSDPEFNSRKVGGVVDAALDLGDVVADRAADLWNALPSADQHKIIAILKRTNEVANRGIVRLKDEDNAAEFKRRREKIRQRTEEISRRSAEIA